MLNDTFLVQPPDTEHTSHTIIKMETNDTVFDDEVPTPQGQSAHVQLFVYAVSLSAFAAIDALVWRISIHNGPLSRLIQTLNLFVGIHMFSYHCLIYFTLVCLVHFVGTWPCYRNAHVHIHVSYSTCTSVRLYISGASHRHGIHSHNNGGTRFRRQTTVYEVEVLMVVDFSVYSL